MATLSQLQHLRTQTKNLKSVLPPYHRTGDSAGEYSKSGVNLEIVHISMLYLFDLLALHFGFIFGYSCKDPIPGSGVLLGKQI